MIKKLTRTEFDVLAFLEELEDKSTLPTQRSIAGKTKYSVGTVNKTLLSLSEKGFIKQGITEAGLNALSPYKVRRAVFIAAGFGSRLVPITFNTPKPLVRVKGVRIIDTLLDAVVAAGIEDIVIVRGYLWEQFDQLLYKYPNIKFVENPIYNESNNISSLMCARTLLQNSYVLESDLLLRNPALITKYQWRSNYLGVSVERTEDWCFEVKNNCISKIAVGGTNCYHMFGISYWNSEDGARLAGHIERVYNMPGGKERYWDLVPLQYFIKDYNVEVRPCAFSDIAEIDTFKELKALDETYKI